MTLNPFATPIIAIRNAPQTGSTAVVELPLAKVNSDFLAPVECKNLPEMIATIRARWQQRHGVN